MLCKLFTPFYELNEYIAWLRTLTFVVIGNLVGGWISCLCLLTLDWPPQEHESEFGDRLISVRSIHSDNRTLSLNGVAKELEVWKAKILLDQDKWDLNINSIIRNKIRSSELFQSLSTSKLLINHIPSRQTDPSRIGKSEHHESFWSSGSSTPQVNRYGYGIYR